MNDKLDEIYRQEGWGKIAEAALGIAPSETEIQARDVARYAAARIAELEAALKPFAVLAEFGDKHAPEMRDTDEIGVSVGDLRRARVALGKDKG